MNAVGGRYLLKEQLGSGGMGVVWLAHDELLHREVAVKQLKLPDLAPAASEVARTRAMREARIAARLQHPNAIAVYDVVVEDDLPWIVMEYLPSRSLAALLEERGPLTPAEAARIGEKTAKALAAAHAAGIVHRDVKPGNVLIGHDGAVKLTDFGISRATGDITVTEAGAIAGTPAYLAPEVARGEAPDARSDVFSLGATLFAAVESRSPYGDSDNHLGLLYRAATGALERPTRAGSLLRPLTLLLAVDPAVRPTAAQAAALLEVLPTEVIPTPLGLPVQAPRPTPTARGPVPPLPTAQSPVPTTRGPVSQPPVTHGPVPPLPTAQSPVPTPRGPVSQPPTAQGPAPTPPPAPAPAARTRPRWLAPVVAACVLAALVVAAIHFLPLRGPRHGGQLAGGPTTTESAAAKPVTLNATVASNFVLGYFRSAKNETRTSWEKMGEDKRPTFAEYEQSVAAFDEVTPDANPEVAKKGDDYLVIGKVRLVKNGKTTARSYRITVRLVDGQPKIYEDPQ
ncbi:protein kinase [Umezawaea sp. NPDC059074]|uniref:serine/threonine-protein kinase n=1 Tax=Umezawaea sp. NPDC059074 TaxID=3346716 RepID=UPI00368DF947